MTFIVIHRMFFPRIFLFENRLRSHTKDPSLGGVTFSPVFLCKKIGAFYIKISDFRLNALYREKVKQVCGLSPVGVSLGCYENTFFMGKNRPLGSGGDSRRTRQRQGGV